MGDYVVRRARISPGVVCCRISHQTFSFEAGFKVYAEKTHAYAFSGVPVADSASLFATTAFNAIDEKFKVK